MRWDETGLAGIVLVRAFHVVRRQQSVAMQNLLTAHATKVPF